MDLDALFWQLTAIRYDDLLRFPPYLELVQQVKRELKSACLGRTVLDAGAGTGNLALELGREGFEVVGLDLSTAMLARAERKRKKAGLHNVHFLRGDMEAGLPFPDSSFHHVVAVHSLYALGHRTRALAEFRRVLKSPGQLIVCEFWRDVSVGSAVREAIARRGIISTLKMCFQMAPLAPFLTAINLRMRLKGRKYRCLNGAQLRESMSEAGFTVAHVTPAYAGGASLLAISGTSAVGQRPEDTYGLRFLGGGNLRVAPEPLGEPRTRSDGRENWPAN